MTKTEIAISQLQTSSTTPERRIDFLKSISDQIEQIGRPPTGYAQVVNFDYLPHNKVVEVIKLFPGKWEKRIEGENSITYTREVVNGWTIRCYAGNPPQTVASSKKKSTYPKNASPLTSKPSENSSAYENHRNILRTHRQSRQLRKRTDRT